METKTIKCVTKTAVLCGKASKLSPKICKKKPNSPKEKLLSRIHGKNWGGLLVSGNRHKNSRLIMALGRINGD